MSDIPERVAVLESRAESSDETLKELAVTCKEINDKLTRSRGWIGGALFVIAALGTGLSEIFKKVVGLNGG